MTIMTAPEIERKFRRDFRNERPSIVSFVDSYVSFFPINLVMVALEVYICMTLHSRLHDGVDCSFVGLRIFSRRETVTQLLSLVFLLL